MAQRILISTFLILSFLLAGKVAAADRKNVIKPPSISLPALKKILLKKAPLLRQKAAARSGDFWTPEMLRKIKPSRRQ